MVVVRGAQVEPPHKMKGLFWSPIPPVKVQSTVWGHLKDFKEFDVKALLDDFAAKTETAAKPATKSDAPKVRTRGCRVHRLLLSEHGSAWH